METIIKRGEDACGGLSKLAERMGVEPQVIVNWRTRGVPLQQCAEFEAASKGTVRRWELRPDDWFRIWPELVGSAGSPAIPAQEAA